MCEGQVYKDGISVESVGETEFSADFQGFDWNKKRSKNSSIGCGEEWSVRMLDMSSHCVDVAEGSSCCCIVGTWNS